MESRPATGTASSRPGHLSAALDAIDTLAPALVRLVASIPDPSRNAIGHWTVGDVAAHLSHAGALEVGGAKGLPFEAMPDEISAALGVQLLTPGDPRPREPDSIEDVAGMNDLVLRLDPERNPRVLAARIERSAAEFTSLCRSADEDRVLPWLLGTSLPLSGMAGHMLFEMLLHGDDVARAAGHRWRIDRSHACIAFEAFLLTFLPQFLGAPRRAAETGSAEIRLRGGARVVLVGHVGPTVALEPPGRRRSDFTLSADPAAMLLMISGRRGRISTAVRGQVLGWGRHPVRAMRMLDALALHV